MENVKIAIVGIGNCASSLIQGIYHYKSMGDEKIPGILHNKVGGYSIGDIKVVAAFDIDARKVGKDVSLAIFAKPNNAYVFHKEIPSMNVKVNRGPTLDGFPEHMKEFKKDLRFVESKEKPIDVASILQKTKPDMLINYLPVGSQKATEYYAGCCLEAGVSFINAIPVFIFSSGQYINKFYEKELICIGDDIKSQVGATIVHRVLTNLFKKRGITLKRTYQLNTGGNTDFLNMLERKRLRTKKISKTEAVQSQLMKPLEPENIHIGPSDFVPWQKDNKICFIRMEGEQFGGVPMNLDLRLSVEDSPNSAGVMIDLIRSVKLALDKGMRGYINDISAFGFKHPREQCTDDEASRIFESFIEKNT